MNDVDRKILKERVSEALDLAKSILIEEGLLDVDYMVFAINAKLMIVTLACGILQCGNYPLAADMQLFLKDHGAMKV
jgi:hypothetical protein